MEYNKDIFLSNVYFLIANKKMKIGEVESKCGLSVGYFSRLKNEENQKVGPSIDSLVKLSNLLEADLNVLVSTQINKMTQNETVICDFLRFVLDETQKENIIWEKHSCNDNTYLQLEEFSYDDYSIKSLFTKERYFVDQYYYVTDICGKTFLYVTLYERNYEVFGDYEIALVERDLYIIDSIVSKFSYGTDQRNCAIDCLMANLEDTIIDFTSKNRLSKDVLDFAKSILKK